MTDEKTSESSDLGGLFRKRPVEIRARQVTGPRTVDTLEGRMLADAGDLFLWLITDVEGETYPCKDSVFRRTYEPVDREAHDLWEQ